MNKRLGVRDFIFIGVLLAVVCLVFFVFCFGEKKAGSAIEIEVQGKVFGIYSLSENQNIQISNDKGEITNEVVILDGYAYMKEASCPDHLCMEQKKISKTNENIVCLPNQVIVTVTGAASGGLDAIAN